MQDMAQTYTLLLQVTRSWPSARRRELQLSTGKTVTVEWAQLWVLKDGLVTNFKGFEDTDTIASAFHRSDDHAHDHHKH